MKRFLFLTVIFILGFSLFSEEKKAISEGNEGSIITDAPIVEEEVEEEEVVEEEKRAEKETVLDENKVTVTPKISMYQRVDYHNRDLEAVGTDIGFYKTPIFLRTNIKGSFSVKYKDFTFTPYLQERFAMFIGKDELVLGVSDVSFRARNRFYAGFVFGYSIENIMDISLNTEFRFSNDIKSSDSETIKPDYRFAPTVKLSGSYDFGLKWSYSQFVALNFNKDSFGSGTPLTSMYYETFANISYEFLHNIDGIDDHKASIYADLGLGYSDKNIYGIVATNSLTSDYGLGLICSYKGFSPQFGLHCWSDGSSDSTSATPKSILVDYGVGFKMGLSYKKERFKFGVNYIGGDVVNEDGIHWESRMQSVISYSL